jgi:two-component system, NarL family, sensor kinase
MPISRTEVIIVLSFLTVFIFAMVSFIIRMLFFIQKKQKNFYAELLTVKLNYDKELYKAQMEIQEQTFKEIAREIHDNVGQILSLAKLGLGTLDLDRTDEAREGIAEISDILEKALDDLRHLSRSMNSEIIKKGGLKKSIEMQVGFLQRGGKFNVDFKTHGDQIDLDEKKEIILFRILQEALNNIIRHSGATTINVHLIYNKEILNLNIKDNGKGFDFNEQFSKTNQINGIRNMQQRAKLIEAEFELNSQPGNGTSITIITPY